MNNKVKICSIFSQSKVEVTDELKLSIQIIIEELIVKHNFGIFCFSGLSDFDKLCWNIISKYKLKYKNVYRIFCVDTLTDLNNSYLIPMSSVLFDNYVYFDYNIPQKNNYTKKIIVMSLNSDYSIFYVNKLIKSNISKVYKKLIVFKKNIVNLYWLYFLVFV